MHALETIELLQSEPMNKAKPAHMDVQQAARALFSTFGNSDNRPTRCIVGLAQSGMTPEEYDDAEAQAIGMAKAADTASGWNPPSDAKGRAKYGPKQNSMASQASNRRQIFGAARLNLSAIVSVPESGIVNPDTFPSFAAAYKSAAEWLKKQGIDWKGRPTEDLRREKETKQATAAYAAARAAVEKDHPMHPGETIGQWQERINPLIEPRIKDEQDKAQDKAVKDMAAKLIKEHGATFALFVADEILRLTTPQEDAPM